MAVPEQTPYIEHIGNGVTTSFALKFQCESKDHLIVLIDDIEPPIASWSLVGGNVVFTTAPAAGKKITLQRNTPFSRTTDYQSYNNSFRPPAVNQDFDWIWWKLQELGVADWILGNRISALKNYVDRKDDELKAYLMEEIRKQGVALDQLDEYYNYLMQRLAQIAVDKGWDASFVVYHGISQKKINDGLESITELLTIQNPKNGMRVYVKSYHAGLLKGGGTFVFESAKASTNDGVVIFDGWVRQLDSPKVTTAMAGFTDNSANAVDSIRKCLAYLKSVGGGELELTDGLYILDNDSIIKDPTPNVSAYRYWFEPVNNVTITGTRNAILKVDDNVIDEDALYQYAKGYQVFLDLLVTENKNFKLKGFTFDGNALNNLLIPFSDNPFGNQSQCLFVSFSQCDGFEADDLGLSKTSGHQIFRFSINCKGHSVHHCDFSENGNINGNTNLTDHSSIYNEGTDFSFYHNKFINATFDTVSTAIETHGRNGVVFGNHFKNYNLGVLRSASVSDSHNVIVYGNTGEGLSHGLLFDSANGFTLKAIAFSNTFNMRKVSESGGRGVIGLNVGGSAHSNNTGKHEIVTYDNIFTADDLDSIAILGGKVPYLESKNTFIGFGRYYEHGIRSADSVMKIVLKDKIRNLKSVATEMIAVRNWDGAIANYSNNFDISVQELSGSPYIDTVITCAEASAIISGKVLGVFNQSILPYRGSWNTNNLQADIKTDHFVRDAYVLPPETTVEIKTPVATYQKLIGGSLTSIRRMNTPPSMIQDGGDYVGDIVYNTAPTLGGYIGWVAVASADLVVWKPFGAINA